MKIVHEGVIYKNRRPGYVVLSAFYANMAPISDTEIICVSSIGQALYSSDRRLIVQRSMDGGRTWRDEGLAWDPDNDLPRCSYGLGMVTRLSDGSMFMIAFRHEIREDNLIRHNPETGGLPPEEFCLLHSKDAGRTWSRPQPIAFPPPGPESGLDLPSPIVELTDGRLFMPCVVWKAYDDPAPLHIKGHGLFSADRGRTWADRVDFPSAADHEKMYSHGRYIRMRDGRLCVLQWAQAIGGQTDYDLHIEFGDPTGRQWALPKPTGLPGQSSWIGDRGGGLMIAAYTCRSRSRPGIFVALSEDEGDTWDRDHALMVFDATDRECLGTVHPPRYPASLDNVAYGMPVISVLPGGDVMVHFWCTEACVTQTRYVRLSIE